MRYPRVSWIPTYPTNSQNAVVPSPAVIHRCLGQRLSQHESSLSTAKNRMWLTVCWLRFHIVNSHRRFSGVFPLCIPPRQKTSQETCCLLQIHQPHVNATSTICSLHWLRQERLFDSRRTIVVAKKNISFDETECKHTAGEYRGRGKG